MVHYARFGRALGTRKSMKTGHVALAAVGFLVLATSCDSKKEGSAVKTAATVTTVTTAAPTTTSTAKASAVLAGDGLGLTSFATPMDAAIAKITEALGPADYSGNWVPEYCQTGEGGGGRLLVWGDLAVLFNDGGVRSNDRLTHEGERVLWGYEYGGPLYDQGAGKEVDIARRLQPGLRTASGIGLESTGQAIEEAYGAQAEANASDPNEPLGPLYVVKTPSGDLYMYMGDNGPQGRVEAIVAGDSCGE
jgi:hypothetical protein